MSAVAKIVRAAEDEKSLGSVDPFICWRTAHREEEAG